MRTTFTLAQRIGLGFALILSLLVLVTAVGIERVGIIDSTLTNISHNASLKQRYAINFRGSVHNRAIAIRDAVLVSTAPELAQHLKEVVDLKQAYDDSATPMDALFASAGASAEEQRLLAGIKEIEGTTLASTQKLIELRQAGDIAGAQVFLPIGGAHRGADQPGTKVHWPGLARKSTRLTT